MAAWVDIVRDYCVDLDQERHNRYLGVWGPGGARVGRRSARQPRAAPPGSLVPPLRGRRRP